MNPRGSRVMRAWTPIAVALVALGASASTAAADLPGTTLLQSRATGLAALPSGLVNDSSTRRGEERSISGDGCLVAFTSRADGLSDADNDDVVNAYVRDLCAAEPTTTLVSRGSGPSGAAAIGDSMIAAFSADGSGVAYESNAANLGGPEGAVYVRDLNAGQVQVVGSRATGVAGA